MSDHAVQSHNDGNGSIRPSRRLCQSAWMAHWTDTSCKIADQASLNYEFKEDDRATQHQSLQIDPNSGYESPPTWKCTNPYPPKLEWVSPKAEAPAKSYNLQRLEKTVKFYNFFEKKSLPASRSSKDDFKESASESQMIRESRVSTKFKGKMSSELPSLSLDSGFYGQQGVKLQLLGSSTDSEEKENGGHANTSLLLLKNESSEDTDTLELNALQENHLSAEEDTGKRLPDINQRLPELPAVARSTDDRDTSSSRTQSLDLERLFSNAEEADESESNALPGGLSGPDPSSRWIKRLKLSDSLAHGTKSSKLPEASSHEKADKLFGKTSSEALKSRCHGKDEIKLDKPVAHSWIRRWCHNQAMSTQKSSEAVVICEPETFKETSDKKQFPSIAAMALMGKAMKHFQPCEIQDLGPSVVWNTKQF